MRQKKKATGVFADAERAAAPVEISTPNLGVRFYRRDATRVIVVFASAGARRIDGFSEEFRGTFWSTGVSLVFVTDRHTRWFNYPDTVDVFRQVAQIVSAFQNVGVIGASLGGSGAILFTNYAANIARVVAFAPQYSILPPFIQFDNRYDYIGKTVEEPLFEDFSQSPSKDKIIIIYGNTSWRDYLHSSMFSAAGFKPIIVDRAPHEVAGHLKAAYSPNGLKCLADLFCSFDKPFSADVLRRRLDVQWTDEALRPEFRFAQELRASAEFNRNAVSPSPVIESVWPLISAGKPASQSSICQWSTAGTVEGDAAGALNGHISASHNFHTGKDPRPWWQVDLRDIHLVHEIRIFNRIDSFQVAERAFNFELEISLDATNWQSILKKEDYKPYGGADGHPFIFLLAPCQACRYVRISLLAEAVLHLNQVQVFGEPRLPA